MSEKLNLRGVLPLCLVVALLIFTPVESAKVTGKFLGGRTIAEGDSVIGAFRPEVVVRAPGDLGYVPVANADGTPIAGGGGGGGAVTVADGADVALGATTDAAATAGGTGTVNAHSRLMTTQLGTLDTDIKGLLTANVTQWGGVTISTNSGSTGTGTLRIVQATDQPALTNAQPHNLTQLAGNTISSGNGTSGTGTLRVAIASDQTALTNAQPANVTQLGGTSVSTGTGTVGAGTLRVTFPTDQAANTNAWLFNLAAAATGGATPYSTDSLTNTGISVKGSAGTLYAISWSSTDAQTDYIYAYDKATAGTTSDTPIFRQGVPTAAAGYFPIPAVGWAFTTGISIRGNTDGTDAGNTSPTATKLKVNLLYK